LAGTVLKGVASDWPQAGNTNNSAIKRAKAETLELEQFSGAALRSTGTPAFASEFTFMADLSRK
jgi:hypothetical protein